MPELPPSAHPAEGRVSIGNAAIDAMLDGGLVPHRPYLIVGPSGTGKTKLVLQFLCEGVRRGERVLLVTVEEPPNEVRLNHRALAPELDRVDVFDAIPDIMRYERAPFKDIASVRQITPFSEVSPEIRRSPELSSVEVTITALEQMLRSEVQRRNYSRIAVDSLTALQYFCMKGFDPVGGAQTFLRFLSDLRTTTVLTVESPLEDVETTERALARGEIRLFRWELEGVTVRGIGVEKLRGSSHDVRLHPYRIGPHGIDVNLSVTISRDTRQIIEAAPVPPAAAGRPALEPISDELRDLIVLGVDVRPVRGTAEAALAAVRSGRIADAAQEISRLASRAGALAASVAGDELSAPAAAASTADAQRRVAQRAESLRVGVPPTSLPSSEELEHQLERILSVIPGSPPAPSAPVPAPAPPPAVSRPLPPVSEPSGTAAPGTPSRAPEVSSVAERFPGVDESERAPRPSAPPSVAGPALPARPAKPAGRATAAPAAARIPVPVPTAPRRSAAPVPVPSPMPEPPPLPAGGARPVPAPTSPGPRSPTSSTPPTRAGAPVPLSSSSEAPPPLPNVAVSPPPSPPPASVLSPADSQRPPEPAPKRRRRAAPSRKKPAAAGEAEATSGSTAVSASAAAEMGSKPKRRSVRKRKAPPVVAATPEPLPAQASPPAEAAPAAPPPGPEGK